MVRLLDSGSGGPGSGPGWGHCVVFLARHFTLSVPFSTQVYQWVPTKCWDELASHPGGSGDTPSRFILQKPEISAGMMGPLGS